MKSQPHSELAWNCWERGDSSKRIAKFEMTARRPPDESAQFVIFGENTGPHFFRVRMQPFPCPLWFAHTPDVFFLRHYVVSLFSGKLNNIHDKTEPHKCGTVATNRLCRVIGRALGTMRRHRKNAKRGRFSRSLKNSESFGT